jgi:hypothetical protein
VPCTVSVIIGSPATEPLQNFKKKEKDLNIKIGDKDQHIQELNEAWRKSSEDSLKIISKLGNAIDKFTFVSEKNKEEVMNEIEHLKEVLVKKK